MPYMLPLPSMQQAHDPPPPDQGGSKPQHHPQLMRTVSISILVMSLPVLYVSFLHVPPAALFRDTTFWFLMSNSIIIVIAADSGMLFFGSSSSSVDVVDNDGLPFDDVSRGEDKNDDCAVLPPVENQVLVLREEQEGAAAMVAESDDDHAYALVLRDKQGHRVASSEPECRDIMVVSPPSSDIVLAGGGTMVPANRTSGGMIQLKASRSLAREERLRRRRHSHRGLPPSHSRALVPVQDKSVVLVAEEDKPQPQPQLLRRVATTTEARPSAAAAEEEERESEYSRLSDEELNRRVEEFITRFNREMRMQLEREQQLALAAA